ncbi:MAG: hypothetical protein HFG58_14665 [Lachnospiraceae bacterium]|nr:hypothetical protein [Lachnospiraceae bacterium]
MERKSDKRTADRWQFAYFIKGHEDDRYTKPELYKKNTSKRRKLGWI